MPSKLELTKLEWNDEFPLLPETEALLTGYERQEIRRLWRNAASKYRDAINALVGDYDRLIDGRTDGHPVSNHLSKAAGAVAANQALSVAIDMVLHRLALAGHDV